MNQWMSLDLNTHHEGKKIRIHKYYEMKEEDIVRFVDDSNRENCEIPLNIGIGYQYGYFLKDPKNYLLIVDDSDGIMIHHLMKIIDNEYWNVDQTSLTKLIRRLAGEFKYTKDEDMSNNDEFKKWFNN